MFRIVEKDTLVYTVCLELIRSNQLVCVLLDPLNLRYSFTVGRLDFSYSKKMSMFGCDILERIKDYSVATTTLGILQK